VAIGAGYNKEITRRSAMQKLPFPVLSSRSKAGR